MDKRWLLTRCRGGGSVAAILALLVGVLAVLGAAALWFRAPCGARCCPVKSAEQAAADVAGDEPLVSVAVSNMTPLQLEAAASRVEDRISEARDAAVEEDPEVAARHAELQRRQLAYMQYINSLAGVTNLAAAREASRAVLLELVKERERVKTDLAEGPDNAELAARLTTLHTEIQEAQKAASSLHRQVSERKRAAVAGDARAKVLAADVAEATQVLREALDQSPSVRKWLERQSVINARRRALIESRRDPSADR